MAIRVAPYAVEHEGLVRAFNARLAAGGSEWRFYEAQRPRWLPPVAGEDARRDYFLAIDDAGAVRGGYCLKTQQFQSGPDNLTLASVQGPLSEGLVNPRFGLVALQMMRDMQRRSPRLFVWGASEQLKELLKSMRWRVESAPTMLRVLKAGPFLRQSVFLRRRHATRILADLAAASGAAQAGVMAHGALQAVRGQSALRGLRVTRVDRFGVWADQIWEAARDEYGLIAHRDRRAMNVLLPLSGWPEAIVLRVDRDKTTVGWAAVRDTRMQDDPRFGSLRVGSIIDALSPAGMERSVVAVATEYLRRRGVDVVISHFTHRNWVSGFRAAGYLIARSTRPLLVSPALADVLDARHVAPDMIHLTPLDGDGPHGL